MKLLVLWRASLLAVILCIVFSGLALAADDDSIAVEDAPLSVKKISFNDVRVLPKTQNLTTNTTNESLNISGNISNSTFENSTGNLTNATLNVSLDGTENVTINTTNTSLNISSNDTVNITQNTTNITTNVSANLSLNDAASNGTQNETNVSLARDAEEERPTRTTYVEAGVLLAKIEDQETHYYVTDHLGSVREVRNATLSVQKNDYYAFGENVSVGVEKNAYLFTAQEKEEDLPFYYYKARYYHPETGRFLQPDQVRGTGGSPETLNRYAYVQNNPLKFTDPTGNAGQGSRILFEALPNMPDATFVVQPGPEEREATAAANRNAKYTAAMHDVADDLYGPDLGGKLQEWKVDIGHIENSRTAGFANLKSKTINLDLSVVQAADSGFSVLGHEMEHALSAIAMAEGDTLGVVEGQMDAFDAVDSGKQAGDKVAGIVYGHLIVNPGGWLEHYNIYKIDARARYQLGGETQSVLTERTLKNRDVPPYLQDHSRLADSVKTDAAVVNRIRGRYQGALTD